MMMSLLFTFESVEEWVTCHNLLHKTIMMYILPNYKWYITKKASSFQWRFQKNSMKSPSSSILMPWYAMAIQLRWNGLNLRLPILMGVKGVFHLINLPNGGLMFFLCICMDELRYFDSSCVVFFLQFHFLDFHGLLLLALLNVMLLLVFFLCVFIHELNLYTFVWHI
jgi:hypothetical protein